MATTSRKREKIKKETKVELPDPTIEDEVKVPEVREFLEAEHLKNLEVFGLEIENAKLLMALEEQALVNLQLSLENLQSKIESQKVLVGNKAQKYELAKQKYVNYKKQIWPIYGLNENEPMSYDRNSGKIVK